MKEEFELEGNRTKLKRTQIHCDTNLVKLDSKFFGGFVTFDRNNKMKNEFYVFDTYYWAISRNSSRFLNALRKARF